LHLKLLKNWIIKKKKIKNKKLKENRKTKKRKTRRDSIFIHLHVVNPVHYAKVG
jgi:hypothetical protein